MDLPKSIVKEFAKQAVEKKPTVDKPTQLVGTVHVEDGQTFVYLDGSNGSKTPVSETVVYQSGDRVLVSIQNRKATIIGNYTGPSINQALDNVIVEYALSSNSVSFIAWPGEKGEWNTIAPEKEDGSYMWQRTTKISTNPLINPEISLTCIQGSDGENGYTPYIGSNGNWWINGVDTGYSAEGDDGHSPYVDTTTNTWWEWDADIGGYHDTGIVPQGPGVFKSIVFKRFSSEPSTPTGGSYLSPVPSGWSDGIPSGTEQIWISTRVFTSDGESPQTSEWTTPQMASDIPDIDFEYSWIVTNPGNPTDNPDNWSNTATENSIWMAVRKKSIGTWSSWEINKIKGEMSAEQLAQLNQASEDASQAKTDVANLEIGGRNYVLKTDSFSSTKNGITIEYDGDSYHIYGTNTKTDSDYFLATWNLIDNVLEPGTVYTVSTTEPLPSGVRLGINTQDSSGQEVVAASNSRWYGDGIKTSNTFTCRPDTNGKLIGYFAIEPTCGTVDVTFKIKLEKGNKATDWTPAPEDVDEDIDNVWEKADNAQTSIDNLEIGGRNLLKQYIRAGGRCVKIDNLTVKVGTEVADTYFYLRPHCALTAGETYTISCEASNVPDGCNWSFGIRAQSSAWRLYINKNGKIFATGVLDADVNADTDFILDDYENRPSTAPNIILTNFKLEKGNKATDWTPAPEDIDSRTTVLEAASTKELVRNGFAEFTNDPKLTLGKTTSPWKVVVKNDGIFLQKSSNDVASLSKETSSEETTLRADNARLANVKFRSANGGGKLGIVAQSNGHVSLKEI